MPRRRPDRCRRGHGSRLSLTSTYAFTDGQFLFVQAGVGFALDHQVKEVAVSLKNTFLIERRARN